MDFNEELDALLQSVLVAKKQGVEAPESRNKKTSVKEEPFAFGSDSEEEQKVDTSIVKQEQDESEPEDKPMLEDDVTVKEEYDSMEDDGGSSDEEKPFVDSDGDQSYNEIKNEDESKDDGEVQPKAKRTKKTRTSLNEGSAVEGGGETAANKGKTSKMSKTDDDDSTAEQKRKRRRLGGHSKKRQKIRELQVLAQARISVAETRRERELMSLVFGGRTEIASQLAKGEKKVEDAPKTKKAKKKVSSAETDKAERAAVWHDSDDEDDRDGRNLKRNKYNRDQGRLTNERRRKQFVQIVGNPKWADLDREREPSDSEDEAMRKVGHVVKQTAAQGLPKSVIELKRLKDLTRDTKHEGEIASINFHPTSMVAILSGMSGMVSIVTVDGVRNETLHTIGLEKFRIYCSRLSPDGNEVIFGGYRKFYHVYNLISGESDTLKIPVNQNWCMRNFRISTCGKYLATVGENGEVQVLSAKGKEVLRTIQLRYVCQALAFTPDSRYLLCHSNDTEVTVYSFENRRIVNVWQDEGCVNGSAIAVCPNGQFVATGSRQGVVNIYSLDATLEQKFPVPLKTINNLTTYIDSLTFNATSELLAMASSNIANAMKLVHVKSGTVFKNFPALTAKLGQVTAVEFSPFGGFLAIGNKKSVVSLFRVKHYPNY
uniref:WD repeat-containing protein 55 homolog n=1 Tax=Anopheles atroparvus TaxID=41427 RepID=A0A182JGU4_ANOAO